MIIFFHVCWRAIRWCRIKVFLLISMLKIFIMTTRFFNQKFIKINVIRIDVTFFDFWCRIFERRGADIFSIGGQANKEDGFIFLLPASRHSDHY